MHQFFSRKTLLSMTLWMGVFSCFLQTQAFACCWPWCCCYHQEAPKATVTHRQPLINRDQQGTYGTSDSQIPSLAQKPQSPQPRSLLVTERRDDTSSALIVLPSSSQPVKKQEKSLVLQASASSLVSSRRAYPEWTDETFSFSSSAPCQQVWEVAQTTFGDESLPLTLGLAVKATFSKIPQNLWVVYSREQETNLTKLLYKKVTHYALSDIQEYVRTFVTKTKGLWETSPESFSFAYFPTQTSYYFFAIQKKERVLYIKMRLLAGQNDEKALASVSATRAPSRAVSRPSSPPRREKEKAEEKDNKPKSKENTKGKEKDSTGSDSDE